MFKVTSQYGQRSEQFFNQYDQLEKAKQALSEQLEKDIAMKISVVYRIYDDLDEVVEELDSRKVTFTGSASGSESSTSQGQGKGISPFATTLKPGPKTWGTQKDDEEKKS